MNKGNPSRRGDNPDRPEDSRGHCNPGNTCGPLGNEGSGAPQPPDGGGDGGGSGGGPPDNRVPGGQGGSPGLLGGNPWGG